MHASRLRRPMTFTLRFRDLGGRLSQIQSGDRWVVFAERDIIAWRFGWLATRQILPNLMFLWSSIWKRKSASPLIDPSLVWPPTNPHSHESYSDSIWHLEWRPFYELWRRAR